MVLLVSETIYVLKKLCEFISAGDLADENSRNSDVFVTL